MVPVTVAEMKMSINNGAAQSWPASAFFTTGAKLQSATHPERNAMEKNRIKLEMRQAQKLLFKFCLIQLPLQQVCVWVFCSFFCYDWDKLLFTGIIYWLAEGVNEMLICFSLKQVLACYGSFHQNKIYLFTPLWVLVGIVLRFSVCLFFLWHAVNESRDHFYINNTVCCCISGKQNWLIFILEWERQQKRKQTKQNMYQIFVL